MAASFCCPRCKGYILTKPNGYLCQNCASFYCFRDGYIDFIGDVEFYAGEVSQQEMKTLIDDIDLLGYNEAITGFLSIILTSKIILQIVEEQTGFAIVLVKIICVV